MKQAPNKQYVFLIYTGLALATFLTFQQALFNEFINYDDPKYVTENPHVTGGLTRESALWAFTTPHGDTSYWHPLTWLSHMLDCELFGLNPSGHHLTNLLLHVVNTLMLFSVFRWMTGTLWRSAFVAAAFAFHPLHVESVAWISERKDVLCTLFWMLTIAAYLRYVNRPSTSRYLLALLAFALGLMSKPMIVTLPFVLLLLDYWPLGRFRDGQAVKDAEKPNHGSAYNRSQSLAFFRLVWEKVPFFILSATISVVTFAVQQKLGAVGSISQLPPKLRILNALISYVTYIGKMAWPRRLVVFYPHPDDTLPIWQIVAAALLLLAISVWVSRFARSHRYLLVGWLWYLGTLVPVIGLVQSGQQAFADRYTYIPLTGLFIIIAWGFPAALARWRYKRAVLGVSAGLVLSALTVCTSLQVRHWRNTIMLFEHALKVTTGSFVAHNNLATALSKQGQIDQAIIHYTEALRFDPGSVDAHYNLAVAFGRQERLHEAVAQYTKALWLQPNSAKVHNNLATVLIRQGKIDKAIIHFKEALRFKPEFAMARKNLALALTSIGKFDDAIEQYYQLLRFEPLDVYTHNELAVLLSQRGKTNQAIMHFTEALRISPNRPDIMNNLARLLATHKEAESCNPAKAIRLAEHACKLTGYKHPTILDTLAIAYAAAGRFSDAMAATENAIKLFLASGRQEDAESAKRRLQLYKASRPYHRSSKGD